MRCLLGPVQHQPEIVQAFQLRHVGRRKALLLQQLDGGGCAVLLADGALAVVGGLFIAAIKQFLNLI